jgi:hypothetical protein
MTTLKLKLFGSFCNEWPNIKVSLNNDIYYNGPIKESKLITLELSLPKHNQLTVEHYGKSFGDNRRWDTKLDDQGVIYQDRAVRFEDLILDDVSLKKYIVTFPFVSEQTYYTDYFGHNGYWNLTFETPIYEWIIKQFIVPHKPTPLGYVNETSHSNVFDYSNDLVEIDEIEQYLKEYALITDKSS